jgi:protein-S-isoprenylcysteine O-methyltransferase Ste14
MIASNEVPEMMSPVMSDAGGLFHRGQAHEEIRQVIVWYCILQGVAVLIWWILLYLFPSVQFYFWPEKLGESSLRVLMFGDLFVYCGLGGVVAWLAHRNSEIMRLGLWAMFGGITYATSLSLSASFMTSEAVLGATLMGMSWLGFLHLVAAEYFAPSDNLHCVFRNSKNRSPKRNLVVTASQILVFWSMILVVFPWLITQLQSAASIPFHVSIWTTILGVFSFLVASIINLHTAWTMASYGAGTPFPYDKTNKLVRRGLYKWIRNPMAVTGLAQGASVGIVLGSVFVLVYVLCGGLIWHFLVRPIEEEMLVGQFGAEYCEYKQRVGLWVPKLRVDAYSGR